MRVLFTAQVGAGHWRPLAPFARALQAAGHDIAFATTPFFCARIAEHGFQCFSVGVDDWLETAQPWEQTGRLAEPEQAASVALNAFVPRAERDLPALLALCCAWRPDLLVREQTEFAGCLAAEALDLPHATVQISAWRGSRFDGLIAPPLNRLCAAVGLPPDPALTMLYRYLLLLPFPPRYRDPGAPLPPTARFIRHVPFDLESAGDERLPAWVGQLPERPTVYATLGTAYNRDPGIFAAILAGLRDEPLNLIVTTGGPDPAAFGDQPSHVHVERYLPQSLLFPHCDLVVTHGGSGTVRTALGHGLPLVVIPIAADQPDNARRCVELGLGRVIPPDRRTPEMIREAVRDILHTPRYRRNAERLREEMQALPGLEHAVVLLERLARERRPLVAAN